MGNKDVFTSVRPVFRLNLARLGQGASWEAMEALEQEQCNSRRPGGAPE